MIPVQTVDGLSTDEQIIWQTTRKKPEEIRITATAFEANPDIIFRLPLSSD